MSKIKVLIIDEHILVRRAISNILQQSNSFEIYWLAEQPQDIDRSIEQADPDVILLSLEDRHSNGFTILGTLRMKFPAIPVIAITPRTHHGAQAAINALRIGAIDFVTKPEHPNLILFAEQHLQKRLSPLVKVAKQIRDRHILDDEILKSVVHPQKTINKIERRGATNTPAELIVIGGCTGGVQALFSLVESLPKNMPAPMVIVQHLPRIYTQYLAEKLDSISDVTVREVTNNTILEDGQIWIAPGGYQCEIHQNGNRHTLNIFRGLRENNMRPSIDVLFRSAARTYSSKTLGILLSGCGYDGLNGAEAIINAGGQLIVQDPQTAIASELPLSALNRGLANDYFTPKEIGAQILDRTAKPAMTQDHPQEDNTAPIGSSIIF